MRVTIEIEPEEAARFMSAVTEMQHNKAQEISKLIFDNIASVKINNPWQVDCASDATKFPLWWLELAKSMGGIKK